MKAELLAPGGSYESVLAALNAGADAVYTGGDLFGARAGADNLTTEQLIDVINYAHIHDKKIYLTVNTLLKDKEIEEQLYKYLLPLYENGLDAVIVQDMGVLLYIQSMFPDLHIHASTQMTIFGKETVKKLEELGVQRIVTPRELSLDEIKDIKDNSNLEIESFVHGALCYCYSGQCFMSSYIGGRSGNRGRCAQPCRMEYDVAVAGQVVNSGNNKYVISPKDICTLNILPEIIESGVYSLKIEGRMKKVEYIAGVVSIYRKYLDMYLSGKKYVVDPEDIQKLSDLFNRNGFNESYYKQHNGKNMISLKKPEFRKENKEFTDYLKETSQGKTLKKAIDVKVTCINGKPFTLETEIDSQNIYVEGQIPTEAQKRPIDVDNIKKQVSKLGDTDFIIGDLVIDLDDNLFLPIGAINETRRLFVEKIYDTLLRKSYRKAVESNYNYQEYESKTDSYLTAHIWTKAQAIVVIESDFIKRIYIEESQFDSETIINLVHLCQKYKKEAYIALPYVYRKKDKEKFDKNSKTYVNIVDGFLVRNQEQYFTLKNMDTKFVFDYGVYSENKISKEFYKRENNSITTAPLELNYNELKYRGCAGDEIIIYGYMPVMISANCSLKTCDLCNSCYKSYQLKDRKGNYFDIKCVCKYCYNLMLNCKPLSLFKYAKDIKSLQPESIRLSFTLESKKETEKILKKAENALINNYIVEEDDSTTRGHFKRGVL